MTARTAVSAADETLNMRAEPVAVRLPDLRGDARLSPLPPAASCARPSRTTTPTWCCRRRFRSRAASYRRKFIRDITGQTGYQQRKAQLLNALGDSDWPLSRRLSHFWQKLGPQCVTNAVLFVVLALAGAWWAYPLLWLLPLMTWMMVITRIRNIAEHAVVPDSNDPLRNTRTTRAGLLERAFIAPYYVNYHLEHHCCSTCPATTCRACTRF